MKNKLKTSRLILKNLRKIVKEEKNSYRLPKKLDKKKGLKKNDCYNNNVQNKERLRNKPTRKLLNRNWLILNEILFIFT